jgi:ribose transport system ATP-binding protein
MTALLSAFDLTKRYGSTTVLQCERFQIHAGEIHALLGANGAGKSTLCKIIAGLIKADGGQMKLGNADYRPHNKQAAEAEGVEIVQQELNLIPTLTIAENILLTRMPARFSKIGLIRFPQLLQRASQALNRVGLDDVDPSTPVHQLGVGRQQMVEIATALDRNCRLLILDEPTAALSGSEVDRLFQQLRRLRDEGVGIIYISHRLDELKRLADRITILRDGGWVSTQPIDALTADEMIDLMSGRPSQNRTDFQSYSQDRILLKVENLSGGLVQNVSLQLQAGQRLGIAGLVGSGRTELLRMIFGADRAETGQIQLAGQPRGTRFHHPAQAMRAGLAMVTEDRKQSGLLLTQSVKTNSSLNSLLRRFAKWGIINQQRESRDVQQMVDSMQTQYHSLDQAVETLSGGNQQKVVIAKWLLRTANLFLFDEPTRGIDISARRRIFELFDALAKAGKGIIIVSSDLEELLENCDRIGVMSAGKWVAEFDRSSFSNDRIMQAAFSGYQTIKGNENES